MKTDKQLSIRLNGEQVGILEQTDDGKKKFTYDRSVLTPLSLSMPIREEPYNDLSCEAFFGGLLPESETVRKIIGKKYGISPNNSFALLKAIGYDCAGAISCHAIDEPIVKMQSVSITGRIITTDELYKYITDLPKKPLFMDVDGLKLSLAGVQDKAAICLIDNQIALPEEGCPTTHILKPVSAHYEGLAQNEYFCLKIAKRMGLPVPNVQLKKLNDITYLLIERYDRHVSNHTISRIHQEDFCQALGIPSFKKYQNEGGPGLKDCFGLINRTTLPAVDRNLLATVVVFNYLIGNMDAHGKNFSVLHHHQTNIRLAPFYDIVCTRVYDNLTQKMAMKIGSKYEADHIQPRHWEQLCKEVGYRYLALVNLIEKVAGDMLEAAVEEKKQMKSANIYHPIVKKIIIFLKSFIEKNLKLILKE